MSGCPHCHMHSHWLHCPGLPCAWTSCTHTTTLLDLIVRSIYLFFVFNEFEHNMISTQDCCYYFIKQFKYLVKNTGEYMYELRILFSAKKNCFSNCFACVDFPILQGLFIYVIYLVFCPLQAFSQLDTYLVSSEQWCCQITYHVSSSSKNIQMTWKDLLSYFKEKMINCYSLLLQGTPGG